MLETLDRYLDELRRRGLVIRMSGSGEAATLGQPVDERDQKDEVATDEDSEKEEETRKGEADKKEEKRKEQERKEEDRKKEEKLHARYTLHGRLREHFTHQMSLNVPDRGDRNHFQMSIYADQPHDLPTPTSPHYKMVRGIIDEQIRYCRTTLQCLYRVSRQVEFERTTERAKAGTHQATLTTGDDDKSALGPLPKDLREWAAKALWSRIMEPAGRTEFQLAGGLGRLHAVPQRLRGSYSLVRGFFSLGSISRLEPDDMGAFGSRPFEVYGDWLRSLLNAAIGLKERRDELQMILDEDIGEALQSGGDLSGDDKKNAKRYAGVLLSTVNPNPERVASSAGQASYAPNSSKTESVEGRRKISTVDSYRQPQRTSVKQLRHPYYRDEIAWLYNERGLTSFVSRRAL